MQWTLAAIMRRFEVETCAVAGKIRRKAEQNECGQEADGGTARRAGQRRDNVEEYLNHASRCLLLRAGSSSLRELGFVPEGHSKMAQRDNVGGRCRGWRVPKGRLSLDAAPSAVPSGVAPFSRLDPTLSRWAIAKCLSGTIPTLYSELDAAPPPVHNDAFAGDWSKLLAL